MRTSTLTGVIICLALRVSDAQPALSFEHLSLRQGLSQSVPNDIYQDKTGFLWIATQDGLNRYDGYTFKIFKNNADDTTSLSHSWIWKITEDHQRQLWIATWNGLNRYDPRKDHFIRYNRPSDGSLAQARTNIVFCDRDGQLWVGTWGNGLHRYDRAHDRFEKISGSDSMAPGASFIRSIYQDKANRIWVGTFGAGLFQLDAGNNTLLRIELPGHNEARITAIADDHEGYLWLGTYENGMIRWHIDKKTIQSIKKPALPDNQITAILRDRDDQIWIGTRESGISIYNQGNFTHWQHYASDASSIAGNHIFSIVQDNAGIVWVGSTGLSKYDRRRKKFSHITHQQNIPTSLSNRVVRYVYEDRQQRIWVATEGGGLNRLNEHYHVTAVYTHRADDPATISNNDVRAMVEYADGKFWVGTLGGGLNQFHAATGKFIRYNSRSDYPVQANNIQHLLLDRDSILWIGTIRDGIYWYNTRTNTFSKPDFIYADTVSISSGYINRMDQDKAGTIWIAGWGGGLAVRQASSDTLVRYLHHPHRVNSLANDIVYSSHIDSKGRIWIGTASGLNLMIKKKKAGLNQFDEEFKLYSEKQGLANNVVYGILEDAAGKLWLTTNYGLSCFDPDREEFRNYHEDDGLQEEEFNANAFNTCRDGRLIVGGINGVNIFRPEELYVNTNIPPVAITAMNIFEKPLAEFQSGAIRLNHDQNFISFEFVALDFMAPQRNSFAYKLVGLETDWVQAGSRRYVSYTDLKPGTYTFRVIASNNDGLWNEEGAALSFTIAHPFWQTTWFIALMVTSSLLLVYTFFRYRLEQKLQIERLRTKIASDLHDDVGSNLTRLSMYSNLLKGEVSEQETFSYISLIQDISREVVSTMSDIVWSIDSRSDTMGDLVMRMKDFASQILPPNQIEIEFAVDLVNETRVLSPQVKQNIYLIFKEALHNVVKHSRADRVRVSIRNNHEGFALIIADNGEGMPSPVPSTGNGLPSMQRRASKIQADFRIIRHQGTTVQLKRTKAF